MHCYFLFWIQIFDRKSRYAYEQSPAQSRIKNVDEMNNKKHDAAFLWCWIHETIKRKKKKKLNKMKQHYINIYER